MTMEASKHVESINCRYLDVGEEPKISLMPIEGYENKPLASLEEATKNMKDIVDDLDRMIWLAKQGLAVPKDNLTQDESAAIRLYTMNWSESKKSLFVLLNQTLRSEERDRLKPWFSYLKLILTALQKLPPVKRIVWRGVSEDLSNQYNTEKIWWGFSSCTATMPEIGQFLGCRGPRTMFMIECVNGKAIKHHSSFPHENEILLIPGSYLRVVDKYSPAKNLHIIHLQEATPPYELIKPPFGSPPVSTVRITSLKAPISAENDTSDQKTITPSNRNVKEKKKTENVVSILHAHSRPKTSMTDHDRSTKKNTTVNLSEQSIFLTTQSTGSLLLTDQNQSLTINNNNRLTGDLKSTSKQPHSSSSNQDTDQQTDKHWLDLQYHDQNNQSIKKPNELENEMFDPPGPIDPKILDRIQGSMLGMTIGDALGAYVEFRPHQYLLANPVTDLCGGGTWGLDKGQFTDDTSMALCLANSLIARRDFVPYDQLVRYKWWYKFGYMSSTGKCFDISAATSQSLNEFQRRQYKFAKDKNISIERVDYLSHPELLKKFYVYCSEDGVAGNGPLCRLAPVPLFFHKYPAIAIEYSGCSGQITHGDQKAYDACRYYGALIVAALRGEKKDQLLDNEFYSKHALCFGKKSLHSDILSIAQGSYKKAGGYADGIRGKGYIVAALEAALWAFWSDENSFEKGALAAVNLGDDTDTTAAIYGQLAGAYYGYSQLPNHWLEPLYAKKFIVSVSKWIAYEGENWNPPSRKPDED